METAFAPPPPTPTPTPTTTNPTHNLHRINSQTSLKVSTSPPGSSSTKPKQSKSRNGCVTCKAKRLKCDETKPTCQQCQKRGVPCGGYKKDFKWRPFEESTMSSKSGTPKPSRKEVGMKSLSPGCSSSHGISKALRMKPTAEQLQFEDEALFPSLPTTSNIDINSNEFSSARSRPIDIPDMESDGVDMNQQDSLEDLLDFARKYRDLYQNHNQRDPIPIEMHQGPDNFRVLGSPHTHGMHSTHSQHNQHHSPHHSPHRTHNFRSGQIPETAIGTDGDADDEIEEMIRTTPISHSWIPVSSFASPTPSMASLSSVATHSNLFARPRMPLNSPEVLLSFFDKNTCGIMSMKDGPTENPWRTLIWPLARDSQALYHAISSMTAFHMCRSRPELRVEGMEHMRKSIRFLAQGLSHGNIKADAAVGTTLVLAFSEAFDRHTSTGIEHLRGARVLLNQALSELPPNVVSQEFKRLSFLYNVWVYLDVLARLTADSDAGPDQSVDYRPLVSSNDVDPLLGCAATLFPLIGKTAGLVQRVRRAEQNSPQLVQDAVELKMELENWMPHKYYEPIEDPSADITQAMNTAEAYRWATLLYLHQAVPELPRSMGMHEIAVKVLGLIMAIPESSRCCVVHIYPLLAAGCEAVGEERHWVKRRWEMMMHRMCIGNVSKAWEVVLEVWARRDRFAEMQAGMAAKAERAAGWWYPLEDKQGNTELEVSVKGQLHWLGVMKDLGWEGELHNLFPR
ncbi:fungal-specific transcription factor domain-containing protein [Pyronema omphalodes]|nr:fungal-specific transcription factor domain-containing protein [Pyronema omphalodes]